MLDTLYCFKNYPLLARCERKDGEDISEKRFNGVNKVRRWEKHNEADRGRNVAKEEYRGVENRGNGRYKRRGWQVEKRRGRK